MTVSEEELVKARHAMVASQLRHRDIDDERVLTAMATVPRHRFVHEDEWPEAYADHPVLIGKGQTISQPYMVARTVQLARLESADKVLEVGAGSGYQAVVMATIADTVFACEILPELAQAAQETLARLSSQPGERPWQHLEIACRDGSVGWEEHAPFNVIVVAAGAPQIPEPLISQLAEGGRLVIPVGDRYSQILKVCTKQGGRLSCIDDTPCRYVKLRGTLGWS